MSVYNLAMVWKKHDKQKTILNMVLAARLAKNWMLKTSQQHLYMDKTPEFFFTM